MPAATVGAVQPVMPGGRENRAGAKTVQSRTRAGA